MDNKDDLTEYRNQALSNIKDYFPKVQEALFYLEAKECKYSLAAYIDIRDVLSHYSTLLREDISSDSARDNVSNLCEHLRRAIAEPYQIAFESKLSEMENQYTLYNHKLARWEKLLFLSKYLSPLRERLRNGIIEAKTLWISGRKKKGSNMWDETFEESIQDFVKAYDILFELEPVLEDIYSRIHERKFLLYVSIFAIIAGSTITSIALIFSK